MRKFYHQTDVIALAPAVANFYIKYIKQQELSAVPLKAAQCFRYVEDTLAVWPHVRDKEQKFQKHLNSIHPNTRLNERN
jgi:hypothetical protein